MKRQRSPQEKKILSYARDGRNSYGESSGGSRKAIPKRKAMANRALRRAENVALSATSNTDQVDHLVARTGRKAWRKIPDVPLAEHVGRKLSRRKRSRMNANAKVSTLLKKGRAVAKPRPFSFKGSLQDEIDG